MAADYLASRPRLCIKRDIIIRPHQLNQGPPTGGLGGEFFDHLGVEDGKFVREFQRTVTKSDA